MNAITTLPIDTKTASYTAVVGDVGKRIVMNVASANTITFNNTIFAAGDTIFISQSGAGATTVTAGAGVTINTAGSLVLAQHGGGTLVFTSASVATFFPSLGNLYGVATGGTSSSITVSGQNYTLLQFTSSGTLTVTKSGLFDVLALAGGGSGGGSSDGNGAGGGGAGGIFQSTIYLDANVSLVVGAGGSGGVSTAASGVASTIGTAARSIVVVGGGKGEANATGDSISGGSGGGSRSATARASLAPSISGFAGGQGVALTGGGGGGATAVGNNGASTTAGAGGAGFDVSTFISGSALVKGGGGGGGAQGTGAAGGSGGGGAGGSNAAGTSGTANTGGGGGGGVNAGASGSGGSGIIYIRFKV